jgi:ABC-type transporter Mla subunit MlaD
VPPGGVGYRPGMRLPSLPGPRDVVTLAEQLAGVVPRVTRLLGDAEALLVDARATLRRIEQTRRDAEAVVVAVAGTELRAAELVATAEALFARVQPTLERAADVVDPAAVEAAVRLVDDLGTVAPDLHDLLDASVELNELLVHLPGMGRVKRKVEEEQQESG